MYEKIRKWYIQGLWTDTMVQDAIAKNVITQEEADTIFNSK